MLPTKPVIVYGADWCADCHQAKAILQAMQVDYEYRNSDDPTIHAEMLALVDGRESIPVIVIDAMILQEPSNDELTKALRAYKGETMSDDAITKPAEDAEATIPTHDVIIVGAGPAALTAAIYTTREDIDTLLMERGVVGGLAAVTDKIDNYPGFPDGVEGLKLADDLRKQAERFGAVIELGEVLKLHDEGEYKRLETTDGDMRAKAVLIATGSDYKKVGVPGEKEYYARGVHYCATCDGAFYRDKRLVVIGGGNSAVQETVFLTRFASHIDLLVRSTIKASDVLQQDLQKMVDAGKVTVHLGTTTDEIVGEDGKKVVKVIGTDTPNNQTVEFDTDGVFVFVGLKPNSEFLEGSAIKMDDIGFVETDGHLQTAVPGVFACGDIRSGATMQIASAAGEGATAALHIREYLEGHPVAPPAVAHMVIESMQDTDSNEVTA
jgi:thioredoxin reductase (NADPH)